MRVWEEGRLGDLFEIENGFAFKSEEFESAGIPVIKIKNVKAGRFLEGDFSYVSPRFCKERPNKVARIGDLLISMSGNRHDGSPETWVGKVAPFKKAETYLINQRVGALRAKQTSDVDPSFFGYLLSSWPYQQHFISVATSSGGQANLSPSQILSVPVVVPPISEQRGISTVLRALDEKIDNNTSMNGTLEELANAIFKDWFVNFGPTRSKMEGKAPYLASEVWSLFPDRFDNDEMPQGWQTCSLDSVAEFLNGLALQKFPAEDGKGLPVIKIAQLRSGKAESGEFASSEIPAPYVVNDGDHLFSWSGSLMHSLWAGGRGALNQHLFKVTAKKYPQWFVYLGIDYHMPQFRAIAASKATTMGHIQRHHLSTAMITVPDDRILVVADRLILPLFNRMKANSAESQTLEELRNLLLPKLMSGEIRLKDAEKALEAVL